MQFFIQFGRKTIERMKLLGATSAGYAFENSSFTNKIVEILASFRRVLRFYYRLVGTIMLYESPPAVTRLTVYRGLQVYGLPWASSNAGAVSS